MGYTQHVLTSGTGYGRANGIRMAFLKHVPTPNPNGKKHPLIVYLHGIDHCGATPTSNTDYSTSSVIANKGVPRQTRDVAEMPTFQRIGWGAFDNKKYAWLAPQCSTAYASVSTGGTWPFAYAAEMIKYAQSSMQDVVDIKQIYLVGYSLGGGGVLSMLPDNFIRENIAAAVAIAPGYNSSPNYPLVAQSGVPLYIYATVPDALASVTIADGFVNNYNLQRPEFPVRYFRFSGNTAGTTDHDDIVITVVASSVSGQSFELSNGNFWVQSRTLYEELSQFSLPRAKRAA
jgi:predicted peptidase